MKKSKKIQNKNTVRMIRHVIVYSIALILALVATFALFKGYIYLHEMATLWRGYEAVGGEALIFLSPFLGYVVYINIRDTVEIIKKL